MACLTPPYLVRRQIVHDHDIVRGQFADQNLVDIGGADLSFAELKGANIDAGALAGAILCYTQMPDGSRDESGC